MWAVDKAQELWKQAGAAGSSCNTCHSDPKTSFKTWAASMPMWEPRLNKVLGVEEFVTRHAKATTGASWLMETDENRAMSVYLHFLANGAPIKVDTSSPGAKAAIERGKELSARKLGQLNLACTDCHGKVGQSLDSRSVAGRAERPIRPFPDLAHQPAGDLGHPPTIPVVPGQYPGRRIAAGRQGIWRSRILSRSFRMRG